MQNHYKKHGGSYPMDTIAFRKNNSTLRILLGSHTIRTQNGHNIDRQDIQFVSRIVWKQNRK